MPLINLIDNVFKENDFIYNESINLIHIYNDINNNLQLITKINNNIQKNIKTKLEFKMFYKWLLTKMNRN